MASSTQAQKIVHQGKHCIESAVKICQRTASADSVKVEETDVSVNPSTQQKTTMQAGKKQEKRKVSRPNAFLSFRITNQEIINHASQFQKHIIETNPLLSQASVPIETLHITLMSMT